MADLLGFTSIALVSLITIVIGLRWPAVSRIIYVALSVRVLFILIGHYIIPLPDSTKDAAGLEDLAWSYGKDGFTNALNYYQGMNSFFYSWVIGVFYSLFGRSILMSQSLSLLFGVGSVFLVWFLAKKIWDDRTAIKVSWVVALFPSLILYSALPLREVYSSFFLLVAAVGIFYWTKTSSNYSIFLAIFGFVGAAFFHGPLILGNMVFLFIVLLSALKKTFKSLMSLRFNYKSFIIIFSSAIFFYFFFLNKIYIPKIGYFEAINLGYFLGESKARMIGNASYSEILQINSNIEFLYKVPLRVVYFLFSPFPWNVEKPIHLIGVFDSFLYIFLVYLIFLNRKIIWNDPFLRIILIILICYFFMFAIGVSNFGAGIRHRSKFTIEMILLVGPLIPKLGFSYKNKLRRILKNKS
jgi:4-amino-4-deoxy-L-arabinose transferase-like glycosyltransferase